MKNIKKLTQFILFTLLVINYSFCLAQDSDSGVIEDSEIINLEGVYNSTNDKNSAEVNTKAENIDATSIEDNKKALEEKKAREEKKKIVVKDLKDLNKLAPFREVSVIQKKYMPKSNRVQLFLGVGLLTNTPWYNNYGGKLGLAYHFTENWAIELNGSFLTTSKSEAVKEIRDNNNLNAEQFVYTKNYVGGDIVWSPIYGKMSSLNQTSVTSFDMYFAIGGGTSQTNSQEKQNSTIHFGIGQIFSLGKSMAFRWDYSFNTFQATPQQVAGAATPKSSSYNDLVLTAGLSFFVPEVSAR